MNKTFKVPKKPNPTDDVRFSVQDGAGPDAVVLRVIRNDRDIFCGNLLKFTQESDGSITVMLLSGFSPNDQGIFSNKFTARGRIILETTEGNA